MSFIKYNPKDSKRILDEAVSDCSVRVVAEDQGFSLVEVVFALLIIMISLLGVFSVFTYAIGYNAGNKWRSQALAVMQQEAERIRSAKFNGSTTDAILLGGAQANRTVTAQNGTAFIVSIDVDNAPLVAGLQDQNYQCLSPQGENIDCAIKEITIEVQLVSSNQGWQSAVPVTMVMRRVRGN